MSIVRFLRYNSFMKKKWLILISVAGILALAAGLLLSGIVHLGGGQGNDAVTEAEVPPVLLQLGHDAAPDSALQQALLNLAQRLEQQSHGHIQVELYPYYQAGEDPELVNFTASGALQMCLPLASSLADLPPEDDDSFELEIPESWQQWGTMDGFYLYAAADAALEAVDGETGAAMVATLDDLSGQPLLCLGWAYDGPLVIASAAGKAGIRQPDDLRGQRVAVSGSAAWLTAYQELGARPQPMLTSAIYPALMKEQIDAYQATPAQILYLYLDDYSDYLTLTEHAYAFRPLLVNREWYEGLSGEDISLIDTAVAAFLSEQRDLAEVEYQQSISLLQERGMTVIEPREPELALWQAASK
jgi:TRAP-type C4-dicarboxylate transport system substrate-binding protein